MHRDNLHRHRRRPIDKQGPTVDEYTDILKAVSSITGTGTPPISTLRDAEYALGASNIRVGNVRIDSFSIARGDPMHGAMRSDDHVSDYKALQPAECPECECVTTHRVEYHAYHHIAGSHTATCQKCGHDTVDEEWH